MLGAQPAKAWSGDLPSCSNFPDGWLESLSEDSRFNQDTSWVAFKRDWWGAPFNGSAALAVVWNQSNGLGVGQQNQLYFSGASGPYSLGFSYPSTASLYMIGDGVNGTFEGYLMPVSSGYGYSYATMYDLNCVEDVHNVMYDQYEENYFSDLVANQRHTPPYASTYVAMGDSYSSGEGNSWYESGSDVDGGAYGDMCHRSSEAYPRILSRDSSLNLGYVNFVACSGATTANVLSGGASTGSWGEPAQIDALSVDTEVVTLTIGGNDVGFSSYAWGCTVACGPGTPSYEAIMSAIDAPGFSSNLEYVYERILEEAPNAQVYVMDYPYLSRSYTQEEVLAGLARCGPLNLNGTHEVQVALNSVISQSIVAVDNARLHYVDTNDENSPFEGKYLCAEGGFSSFDILTLHPNFQGQEDYAEVVLTALS